MKWESDVRLHGSDIVLLVSAHRVRRPGSARARAGPWLGCTLEPQQAFRGPPWSLQRPGLMAAVARRLDEEPTAAREIGVAPTR
jgi:hypothetical protein